MNITGAAYDSQANWTCCFCASNSSYCCNMCNDTTGLLIVGGIIQLSIVKGNVQCTGHIEASTSPPPGIPRAFNSFAFLGVGNLIPSLDIM